MYYGGLAYSLDKKDIQIKEYEQKIANLIEDKVQLETKVTELIDENKQLDKIIELHLDDKIKLGEQLIEQSEIAEGYKEEMGKNTYVIMFNDENKKKYNVLMDLNKSFEVNLGNVINEQCELALKDAKDTIIKMKSAYNSLYELHLKIELDSNTIDIMNKLKADITFYELYL